MWENYILLFYKIYKKRYNNYGKADSPVLTTFLILSFLMLINLHSVFMLISIITKFDIIEYLVFNKSVIIIISISFLLLHYILLYRNTTNFNTLINKARQIETEKRSSSGIVYIYSITTILIFISILIFYTKVNS